MRSSRAPTCVFLLAVIVGCSSSNGGGAGQDSGAQEASFAVDAEAPESGAEGGTVDATVCNGSVVPPFVTQNLTLTKACSPWHVPMPVLVGDATNKPVLSIQPGVTVEFDDGAFFWIAQAANGDEPGALQAVGTASDPSS